MNSIAAFIKKSDVSLMYLFNSRFQCGIMDVLMKQLTNLGSTIFCFLIVILLFFIPYDGKREVGQQMIILLFASQAIVQTIKRIVNRPRPYVDLKSIIPVKVPNCKYSFPSGHTCAAFSIALILTENFPSYRLLFFALAFMVGLSRVYLGVHYPTDVVIGAIIPVITIKIIMIFWI